MQLMNLTIKSNTLYICIYGRPITALVSLHRYLVKQVSILKKFSCKLMTLTAWHVDSSPFFSGHNWQESHLPFCLNVFVHKTNVDPMIGQ